MRSYHHLTRTPRYSFTLALPLLLAYEAMAAMLPATATLGLRNAADVMLKGSAYALAGPWGPVAFGALLVATVVLLIGLDVRRSREIPRGRVLALMLGESIVMSVVFAIVVGVVTAQLLGAGGLLSAVGSASQEPGTAIGPLRTLPLSARLMLSLGAGLYEEIVFRVLLVSALAVAVRSLLRASANVAVITAVVLSALAFSAFHYIGPYGDPLELHSFTFRFVAGLAFSALYVLRGFGITAWTHANYDILVLVL